ncbi:heme-degrading monooxygenase HmoA [Bradyrhizobium sp. AZCC 1577]|uniref:antibiotic biosynthesis monooxygenase family protein n=1 Tax=Bradyrhizobium sp. AZCC 1577 TaxID=3117019 RepID=UPI002FF1BE70
MFSVIFEVLPNTENWDEYLDNAKMLRPELEHVEGFVDNIRYKSLTREGWILSLSNWRDEKSLVRWRTRKRHHEVQQKGRDEITPGDLILLISWKDAAAAQAYEDASAPNDNARVRKVRIVRDYGKYDRREAPQYYADAEGGETLHA